MGFEVVQGDCLEVLAEMPAASVDLVLTDPPYFLPAEHYKTRTKWARSLSDLSIIEHFIGSVFEQVRRVLKPEGLMFVFCDGQSYPVFYVKAYRVFDRISDLVWDKTVIGMGQGVRRQHELIMAALPASFDFQGWERSVIACPPVRPEQRVHPAEKPVRLVRQLINLATREGQTVLDPFCGSASTGIAAALDGRNFIGIERDADYVKLARQRIEESLNRRSFFESPVTKGNRVAASTTTLFDEPGNADSPILSSAVTESYNSTSAGVVQG